MKTHQLVISKKDFQILSYDPSFYFFLGDRIDKPADRLVRENYLDQFYLNYHRFLRQVDKAEEVGLSYSDYVISQEKFLLVLLDEFSVEVSFLCWFDLCDTDDAVAFNLISVDDLLEENEKYYYRLNMGYAFLSAYNDTFFSYEAGVDEVKFFYVTNKDHDLFSYTLDEFKTQLILGKPELKDEIEEFINNLLIGIPEQTLTLDCMVAGFEKGGQGTLISSKGNFYNGKYHGAVGFIHPIKDVKLNTLNKSGMDVLTGTYSKDEILRQAKGMVENRRRMGITIGLIQVDDVDKLYRERGEDAALEVIQNISDILTCQVGIDGKLGYIGGGIFMVIFTDAPDMEYMRGSLECILNPVRAAGVTLTMGLSAFPKDADNFSDILLLDEWALARGHEKGGDCYIIYSSSKHEPLSEIKKSFKGEESVRKYLSPEK